jgi:predicted deacylase
MTSKSLLHMTAPLREDLEIAYHDLGPQNEAPRAALVAGLHGNELNGMFVVARLASFLKNLEKSGKMKLSRRVLLIPSVNVFGMNTRQRLWPFDNTDINRMFPGYDQGETTQRIAAQLFKATETAYFRLDFHSSNLHFEEIPQVCLYQSSHQERESARHFSLPAIVEQKPDKMITTTLGSAWKMKGGENFVIQAGYAGGLQPHYCEILFEAVIRFFIRSEILSGCVLADMDQDSHFFGVDQNASVHCDCSGVFVPKLQVGRWVRQGEVLGFLYDGFEGTLRSEVKAPASGLLGGLRHHPLIFEGDLMARVFMLE